MTQSSRFAELAAQITTGIVSLVRSILQRTPASGNRRPIRMEWDNDVPPFPIFVGEVARAEARLAIPVRRRGSSRGSS
jgi:hypothetical protein